MKDIASEHATCQISTPSPFQDTFDTGARVRETKTALLVIDVQQGLDDPKYGARNNPQAERRMAELLAVWRAGGRPVVHVQHASIHPESPLRPELPGHALKPEVLPVTDEPFFLKSTNNAFVDTGLEKHLRDNHIDAVVVIGLTTDHCVSSTARGARDLGFTVTVVEDATATFERTGADGRHYTADVMHGGALASLNGEFASVRKTADVIHDMK